MTINQLTSLTYLDLSQNQISSLPSSIEGCTRLKSLLLLENDLLQFLPREILSLTSLERLSIANVDMEGTSTDANRSPTAKTGKASALGGNAWVTWHQQQWTNDVDNNNGNDDNNDNEDNECNGDSDVNEYNDNDNNYYNEDNDGNDDNDDNEENNNNEENDANDYNEDNDGNDENDDNEKNDNNEENDNNEDDGRDNSVTTDTTVKAMTTWRWWQPPRHHVHSHWLFIRPKRKVDCEHLR